nr:MAG TPA: hypothetical protein [Caudoviricetes sp.]
MFSQCYRLILVCILPKISFTYMRPLVAKRDVKPDISFFPATYTMV